MTGKHARPTPGRLTVLAMKTLEDALEEAHAGPVKRNAGHRLAIGWLAMQRVGLDWHYKALWDAMVETNGGGIQDGGKYVRTTHMRSILDYWRRSLKSRL